MVWHFVSQGGWWMVPIVLCSIAATALLLERAWFFLLLSLRRDEALRRELMGAALSSSRPRVRPDRLDRRRAARSRDPLCQVLNELVRHPDDPRSATLLAERTIRASQVALPILDAIAAGACGLGITGTLFCAFGAGATGVPLTSDLAINTTIMGLLVYVAARTGGAILGARTNRLASEIEEAIRVLGRPPAPGEIDRIGVRPHEIASG